MSTSTSSPVTLGTAPIGKLLLQYSVPAIIASVATSLYNIVDSIFIGQGVGPMAIAGLAITFPLMNLLIGFCTLIAVGGATISSIFLGQDNARRATVTVNTVTVFCLIHAIVFGAFTYIFLDEILELFGATQETLPYAREFIEVIIYGVPISFVFLGLNNIMRATGYPKEGHDVSIALCRSEYSTCANLHIQIQMGHCRCSMGHCGGSDSGIHMGTASFHVKKELHSFRFQARIL